MRAWKVSFSYDALAKCRSLIEDPTSWASWVILENDMVILDTSDCVTSIFSFVQCHLTKYQGIFNSKMPDFVTL